jgi:hypothetical protein
LLLALVTISQKGCFREWIFLAIPKPRMHGRGDERGRNWVAIIPADALNFVLYRGGL